MGSKKKHILNVGREAGLVDRRHQLLLKAGFLVTSADAETAAESVSRGKFHALVVGAWITKVERNRLVTLVKGKNPSACVVFYYDGKIDDTEAADAILNNRGDHDDLIKTLHHLFNKRDGKSGGGALKAFRGIAVLLIFMGSALMNLAGAAAPSFVFLER